ncbi:S-adenosyl-L-methionine-dependent methyltransferase [Ilyonectria robusta]|uniref:S-adenosyl-L-methionine-dependent methyltransferase n=1 Tax=Ilyonectria robusta TaxID=1079257 RepID=UPI001E8E78B6|nr:S-adenosyl-L-methionine-dependent methyltransferase [Ilyonectria robusta]KAH8684141.1 S-adenosyl-L-methionine-dependent methyltransferase [Ilyonectria robusta]
MTGPTSPEGSAPQPTAKPVAPLTGTVTPPLALPNLGVIEADDFQVDNTDSFLGDDAASSTASIGSSILRYREENGRTYHAYKDGQYLLPNDTREQDRLDLQHHLFLLTFDNKMHLSPAGSDGKKLRNVLDVGTGTGAWALDFADEHPETQVIGVDLSPIQGDFAPPNLNFQVDDLEEPWTFHVKFDFIYSRMMTAGLADWPRFFEQAFENLTPGGWLELADICPITCDDGTMKPDAAVCRWVNTLLDGTKIVNRPFDGAYQYKEQMEAAGFTNLTQVVYKWPQNRWPKDQRLKELGAWTLENISSGLEGLSAAVYTRVLGWSKEEMDVLLAEVRNDLKNPAIHSYWPIVVVYGQKPE